MNTKRMALAFSVVLLLTGSCTKSERKAQESKSSEIPSAPVDARIHWLGKKNIAAATNSMGAMRIWREPESIRLEAHLLDKLSLAPWHLWRPAADTNAAALLRPLFNDVLENECHLEVRAATNQPGELAFAIRLSNDHAGLWETNLPAALEALTGIHPALVPHGGSLKKHDAPNFVQWTRIEEWTVVGIGSETNTLFEDFGARIRRVHTPGMATVGAKPWIEADVDLRRVAAALSLPWNIPEDFPRIFLSAIGDGENVRTHGDFTFARPLALTLEPWDVPTNIVHGPLASFTAIRGLRTWLGSARRWNDLGFGEAPNRVFVWAGNALPMQTLFLAASANPSDQTSQISDSLLQNVSPWLKTNGSGYLKRSEEFNGVVWTGIMPFITPFVRAETNYIMGGSFQPSGRAALPNDLLQTLNQTNLLYYDWEITGPRIEAWFRLGQFLRVMLHKSQLPPSAGTSWLQANLTRLGNCVTVVNQTAPERLTLVRRSSTGFTAIELHLLADWLESPEFPRGLNTFLGSATIPSAPGNTNSPANPAVPLK